MEPGVCVSSKRFETVRKLSNAGIFTGILMMPLLPYLNDTPENVLQIIRSAHDNGAKFIYPLTGLTLRAGQREYLYQKFDEIFPDKHLKQIYMKTYGSSYEAHSPRKKELWQIITSECRRLGILYQMEDIIKAYRKNYEYRQLSLFQD